MTGRAIPSIFELPTAMITRLRKSLSAIPLLILCLALTPDAASRRQGRIIDAGAFGVYRPRR